MQQRRMEILELTRTILVLVTMSALSITTSLSASAAYDPGLEIKPSWQDNSLAPIISEICPPNERCWELLPAVPVTGKGEIVAETSNSDRLEQQAQIDGEMYSQTDPWKGDSRIFVPRARSTSTNNQRQLSQRPVKKDFFTSRSWGPGGLPFSVLYMNPHTPRINNRPNTGTQEVIPTRGMPDSNSRRSSDGPAQTVGPTKNPNYRVAPRNGASGQPRRQYSIIPQLFISYGWGPLGK